MFKKKAKNTAKTPIENSKNEISNEVLPTDFTYVQKEKNIHDVKFEAKPTTYFKDAMKRFFKNKSSVVATIILMTLIGMAIIVPIADGNDIETNVDSSKYLPPRWFGINDAGFMDGTGNVSDIVLDPKTKKLPADSYYKERGVYPNADAITVTSALATGSSESVLSYGEGGYVSVIAPKVNKEGGVNSRTFSYSTEDDLTITVNMDYAKSKENNLGNFAYSAGFLTNFGDNTAINDTYIALSKGDEENTWSISGISQSVKSNAAYLSAGSPTSFNCKFAIVMDAPTEDYETSNGLYISGISYKVAGTAKSEHLDRLVFSDATAQAKAMKAATKYSDSDTTDTACYYLYGTANFDIVDSSVYYGAFRYDYYAAAFGEDTYTFSSKDIEVFIKKGYMTYVWTGVKGKETAPGEFKLTELGETYCPIRGVTSQTYQSVFGVEQKELNCTRSLYRYDYYKGYITKCEIPSYFFGTDHYGHDFFKLAFSGLLTSLGLGLFASIINITIGLIWGAVSGYFGGWTDMIMERFTEILGGMPWIVVMTLIVLFLGSNFWTFLLALCLTGWIGMSSETRSQFYRFKGREYVLASRTLGASDARLIFKHILPNGIGTIITSAILMIPGVIFTEANISYLLPGTLAFSGSQSFGITLSNAQADIRYYPYLIVSASIVMILIMISFNLFGNGLRDAFNPSLKGSDN